MEKDQTNKLTGYIQLGCIAFDIVREIDFYLIIRFKWLGFLFEIFFIVYEKKLIHE